MKKRNLVIGTIISLFLATFVSAYNYNYYSTNILTRLFENINIQTLILYFIFFVIFGAAYVGLNTFQKMKDYKGLNVILSLMISLIGAYSLYREGWTNEIAMYLSRFSQDMMIPVIFLAAILVLLIIVTKAKLRFGTIVIVVGAIVIAISRIGVWDWYEFNNLLLGGIITIIVGFIINSKKKKEKGFRIALD